MRELSLQAVHRVMLMHDDRVTMMDRNCPHPRHKEEAEQLH